MDISVGSSQVTAGANGWAAHVATQLREIRSDWWSESSFADASASSAIDAAATFCYNGVPQS